MRFHTPRLHATKSLPHSSPQHVQNCACVPFGPAEGNARLQWSIPAGLGAIRSSGAALGRAAALRPLHESLLCIGLAA